MGEVGLYSYVMWLPSSHVERKEKGVCGQVICDINTQLHLQGLVDSVCLKCNLKVDCFEQNYNT